MKKQQNPVTQLSLFQEVQSLEHWENIRRAMSIALDEKLESAAERKRRNIIERHEKAGFGDAPEIQRLRARDENIRVYKELKGTIGRLVDNPNWAEITNAEYQALFGMVAKQLKALLNSDSIRDSLPSYQLQALTYADSTLSALLKVQGQLDNVRVQETIRMAIAPIGAHLRFVSEALVSKYGIRLHLSNSRHLRRCSIAIVDN